MSRGYNRQGLNRHVVAVLQTVLVYAREAVADPICRAVRDVQVHVVGLLRAHFAEDRATDDITRGQLEHDGERQRRSKEGYRYDVDFRRPENS